MVVLTSVVLSILFSLATSKAIVEWESPEYTTKKDVELGERQRNFQQSPTTPLSLHLFEGDIAGIKDPKAYVEQLHAAMTQNNSNGHANAIKSPLNKWPNAIIPYTIDGRVNAAARAAVASAIKEIQEKTCVQIVPRTKEVHYVNVESGYESCFAQVGLNPKATKQVLNLGAGCENHHTAVHELMHMIGFHHEHKRRDRDNYIRVVSSNINTKYLDQFDVLLLDEATDLNTNFDFDSVMLYDPRTASKNGETVLVTQQWIGNRKFGNAPGLSPTDVLKINLLYDCANNVVQRAKGYKAGQCADSNVLCPTWKLDRQCERNSAWMKKNCRKTCGQC